MSRPMDLDEAIFICATKPANTEEWAEAKEVLKNHFRRRQMDEIVEKKLSEDG